ncbi:MAG: PQQ-dependent sugar dehydrogenase [Actinobacteria bacterium]|nr:PQQ-dependent sugar dehydrogenase [Actinomycetota bacterium]
MDPLVQRRRPTPRPARRRENSRRGRRSLVVATVLAALPAVGAVAPASPAAALPFGYSDTLVGSVPVPVGIRRLPTGVVAVLGKAGRVHLARDGVVLPAPALALSDVCTESERGLLGIAAAPDLATTGHVYLYATRTAPSAPGGCVNRVSRFTMAGDVIDPASEVVLVDGISSVAGNHNGGDLEIGKDGMLWISVGDAGRDPRGDSGSAGSNDAAQDLSLLNGKILRVDPATGGPAPGNPYTGAGTASCRTRGNTPSTPTTTCQEIYASGFRNPWRFAFDPNAAAVRAFVNDVGQGAREEVDELVAGGNYGWPAREGACPQGQNPPCAGPTGGLIDPITDYPRSQGTYITGGAFVPNGFWPRQFDGAYLFGDGGSGRMWVRTAAGTVNYAVPFHTAPGMSDMDFVPEPAGLALYYVLTGSSQVRKVVFPTQPIPTASAPLRYQPTATAERVFDSRRPADGAAPLAGNTARTVTTGVDGAVTRAVLVNIAYVAPDSAGFLTAWAAGAAQPFTSNVNALAGEVVANAAVVPVDAQGRIQLLTNVSAHVVVDLLGTFVDAPGAVTAGRFVPLAPDRLIDTRDAAGADNAYSERADAPVLVVNAPVAGRSGTPTTGVSSVVLTVTAVSSATSAGGWVAVAPGAAPRPPISNLNSNGRGDIRPNLVVVPLGADGSIDLHLFAVDHLVVDVTGYFTDSSAPSSTVGRFRTLSNPYREVDTRTPFGFDAYPGPDTRELDPVVVPAGAIGVAHNLTIVNNAAAGFVTAFGEGGVPGASTANASGPAQLRAAAAFTRAGGDGRLRYYSMVATDLVIDVTGWFEGPA